MTLFNLDIVILRIKRMLYVLLNMRVKNKAEVKVVRLRLSLFFVGYVVSLVSRKMNW